MKMENYDTMDGKKVWLTEREVTPFLSSAGGTQKRITLGLGARCCLRASEIVE